MDKIGEKVLSMFTTWLKELVEMFSNFLQHVLFNYDGLGGYALKAYNLFVFFGGIMLVAVCLGKVITQLLSEAEGSQEANIWWTLVQSVKAGGLLVLMPLVISLSMNYVVKPFGNYFIENMGVVSIDQVDKLMESENFVQVFNSTMSVVLVWVFILIVLGFFVIKTVITLAQITMDEIISPLCAISIVTDNFNFMDNWWRDILSHVVTLITLCLSMLLFTEALALSGDTLWTKLPAMIGSGALVISGPSIVKSIWYSSGAGRSGMGMARTVVNYAMYKSR
ncbi:hypothetical protein LZ578_12095 (plasmid) [Jeotgalibaca sp. MA1X17-3]|uniref:conjugal transfer protein TrbL family protein n=1 Tax=Jeotgalibaca sp. MA1X17-3 TaxID=2908211 RepID=UPI001F37203E|nr:hypothetical protein [Jeotgalibaca sp. MA1X17-3]UJF16801.1 hypothetical protein LZ578_12095 [Jeotgalibaca sp. MA1X17-3]